MEGNQSLFQSPWIRFAHKDGVSDVGGGRVSIPVDKVRASGLRSFKEGQCVFQSPWIRFALILKGDAFEDAAVAMFQSPWIRFAQE